MIPPPADAPYPARRRYRAWQLRTGGATMQQVADAITYEFRLPARAYGRVQVSLDLMSMMPS